MKAVSGKTWVQKAVFLEPKPLFSSAFTMWSRGWYLCMEFRMIWARGEGEDIPWEWRGYSTANPPTLPEDGERRERKRTGARRSSRPLPQNLRPLQGSLSRADCSAGFGGIYFPRNHPPPDKEPVML